MHLLKNFSLILLLIGTALGVPSFDHSGLSADLVLPFGGVQNTDTGNNLVIRGVYGGRKKRYIVEREEGRKCCRKKICLSVMGEILDKDCKCKKCPTGVPALDGLSCQDECPKGQEKNDKGGCCPVGQKAKAAGDGCEDAPDKTRKGKCPGDKVLDPKEGPQDPNTPNPKCAIDDEKTCKKPNIPGTRPTGKENDPSYKVECGKPDPKDKTKCNPKTQYLKVYVDSDGKAQKSCVRTKQYEERKKNKPKKLFNKLKERWNKEKPEREKKEKARKEALEKEKKKEKEFVEKLKEGHKNVEQKERKRTRMGKCATVVSLMLGVEQNTRKRDEGEHPYDWTTDFFDEDFIERGDILGYWPNDLTVEEIIHVTDVGVDADAWMKSWEYIVARNDMENYVPCSTGKRSMTRRCRRTLNNDDVRVGVDVRSNGNNTSLVIRDTHPYLHATNLATRDPETNLDLEKRNLATDLVQKRNPVTIIVNILVFALRLASSLLSRTAASIARYAPRLASLAKNTERLFKLAPKGQGARSGVEGMKNALRQISQSKQWRHCLKEGVPLP